MMKKFKIRKVVGLFLFLALAMVLIVRCEKDPVLDSTYIIKATSVGIGGTVSPSTIEVANGENAAVALKPDSGYDVDVVKVDGNIKPVPTNLIYNFSGVVANHNMEVTWKKKVVVVMHKVEILLTTGGSVSSSLTQVADGLGIDFTFTSDSGFKPDSVVVNGKSYSLTGNTYSLTNVTTDLKVKGVFAKTNLWYLIQNHWIIFKLEARQVGTLDWYNQTLGNPEFNFELAFYSQYKYEAYNENGQLVGKGPYSFTADSLILGQPMGQFLLGGIRNKVILLNNDSLIVQRTNKFYNQNGQYVPSQNIEFKTTYKTKK